MTFFRNVGFKSPFKSAEAFRYRLRSKECLDPKIKTTGEILDGLIHVKSLYIGLESREYRCRDASR
jgi:hypothetical protein